MAKIKTIFANYEKTGEHEGKIAIKEKNTQVFLNQTKETNELQMSKNTSVKN